MKKIRLLGLFLATTMIFSAVGCQKNNNPLDNLGGSNGTNSGAELFPFNDSVIPRNELVDAYADKEYGFQTELPENGEEVAVLHTNMGDIYIRLFPEAAPKAVENFKTHIKNGYYDGLTFHRVINNFMIQGGDPEGNGTGGESIWGKPFEDEFCEKLVNIRGSLAMANSGTDTNGSQFFINQAKTCSLTKENHDYDTLVGQLSEYFDLYYNTYGDDWLEQYPDKSNFVFENMIPNPKFVPDAVWDLYKEHGGNIHLDGAWRGSGGHTVFGQVYEGMDVVDAIAKVEADSETNKPVNDVIVESAEIVYYR